MLSFLYTLFVFLVAIAILVVIHEYGHFWVARRVGVKVLKFSVGFGKSIFRYKSKKSGTEYQIAAIPLGGYVKMLDEREGPVQEQDLPYAFNRKPLLSRIAVVIAGPIFNLLFAVLAYWLMYTIGITTMAPVIGEITPNSIAAQAGIKTNQEIIRVDGKKTDSWNAVNFATLSKLGSKGSMTFTTQDIKNKAITTHTLNLKNWHLDNNKPRPIHALGIRPFAPKIPAIINKVLPNTPATKAGLKSGDKVISANGQPVVNFTTFVNIVQKEPGKKISLTVSRQGKIQQLTMTPEAKKVSNGKTIGFIGVQSEPTKWPKYLLNEQHYSWFGGLLPAITKTWQVITLSVATLGKIIIGHISLRMLSGPIGIAQGAGVSASIGFAYYLGFLALISINLGIINLLPIPVLDGGHLLYYVAEFIRGKPLSEKTQELGYRIGLLFLLTIIAVAVYNDLLRL